MTQDEIRELFEEGIDCAQAVLMSAADELDIPEEDAQKYAAAFGGGMFTGDTCGCVVGALMAIGLKYGHTYPVDQFEKQQCRAKALAFKQRFTEKFGSVLCRDILGADIGTPEGMREIMEKNLLFGYCPSVAEAACEILEEML